MATIADNCDDILDFIQSVAVKSPRVTAAPLSLLTEKCARVWFRRWPETNLPTPSKTAPQDHTVQTGVLRDVVTRLHTEEALRPVVAAQSEAEKETKGWNRIPPMSQRLILSARTTNGTSIPNSPPPILHRFLNARKTISFQDDCALTYTGNNIYLPTSFCQYLLQGHILEIIDLDAPKGLSLLLSPTYSAGPANTQQRTMRIQVFLSMGHDLLPKEEAGELLDQGVHVLAST